MALSTFDKILNAGVPALIILVVVGFIWVKTPLGAWLGPIFSGWWQGLRGGGGGGSSHAEMQRIITYE